MSTAISDHAPLLIDLNASHDLRRRLRFKIFWPKLEGFQETVPTAWNSIPSQGKPFKVLDTKLRATAKGLTSWSLHKVGYIHIQITMAMEVILS